LRINYISYVDPTRHQGGGEMISAEVIRSGILRGHTFSISTVRPEKRIRFDDSADLDLVVDTFNYPHTLKSLGAWRDFSNDFRPQIIKRNQFIHLTNAYTDICNEPYLPCSGNAAPICPSKSPVNLLKNLALKDFSETCFSRRDRVRQFFSQSKLNIFLSPLHRNISLNALKLDFEPPSFIFKPTIDPKIFFNQDLARDIDYLFVGVIGEAKGLEEMRQRYSNSDIHFVGKLFPGASLGFGTHHGSVPYDQIPKLMNRAKNFVFLPRWPEPQGRVVIEAALCGCNLITNDRVGATSFPFDISKPENFMNSTQELWEEIEKAI
jgi:glycosyltransferase involved in cell wall biosynthesis